MYELVVELCSGWWTNNRFLNIKVKQLKQSSSICLLLGEVLPVEANCPWVWTLQVEGIIVAAVCTQHVDVGVEAAR